MVLRVAMEMHMGLTKNLISSERLTQELGLSEEFFVSCVSVARDNAFFGETKYHLASSFSTKQWHNLIAVLRERIENEYSAWRATQINNLPVFVNDDGQRALFIAPMAKSGVASEEEIELKRSFGVVAKNLCSNNELELPFADAPKRITHDKVPRPYEVWALVRQMESRESEIRIELVKFTQETGIIDRIPLPTVPSTSGYIKTVERKDETAREYYSDIEINISKRV